MATVKKSSQATPPLKGPWISKQKQVLATTAKKGAKVKKCCGGAKMKKGK